MADKDKSRGLTVKIDVEVSEALVGLKAIQREAKKATQALRELETYYESEGKRYYVKWLQSDDDECTNIDEVCVSVVPTEYLLRELAKRTSVIVRKKSDLVEAIPKGFTLIVVDVGVGE